MTSIVLAAGHAARRRALLLCAVISLLCAGPPLSAEVAATAPPTIRDLAAGGRLAALRWPDFADYRPDVQTFYEEAGFRPAWIRDTRPTPQALAVIEILQRAKEKGLDPEAYDASRWSARSQQLERADAAAAFEVGLTVSLMRYVSDLHVGRVNPRQVKFAIDAKASHLDLAHFVRQELVPASDLNAALGTIEPQFAGYLRSLAALHRYLELARQDDGELLPAPPKGLETGGQYLGAARLTRLLRLLGDLPAEGTVSADDVYGPALVGAVKSFQLRHGLSADGRLGAQTLKQLNTPVRSRTEQLGLVLERWRWISTDFTQPPVVVNIPEFRLRALDNSGKVVLSMNVIVGKALRHETPVFRKDMQYLVFRPYWNVPRSIQRSEIVPAIQRDRSYLARKNYEVATWAGELVTSGDISDEVLEQLRTGKLSVRQKPGPRNALGLLKLIFPNEYNVYLHSTPAQQLFSQSRRDFSHGCIRVEKPEELAAWALQGKPDWTLDKVRAAMQSGKDNVQVNLAKPIPVVILYGTAVTDEAGSVHFYDDIYGHDAELSKALAKGYPYHR